MDGVSDAKPETLQGGVVFRRGAELVFLPATIASKILPLPSLTRVPCAPPSLVGITLAFGEVLPVVDLSDRIDPSPATLRRPSERDEHGTRAMLVCHHLGDRVALTGIDVVAVGRFEDAGDSIRFCGQLVPYFDISAVIENLREGRWLV